MTQRSGFSLLEVLLSTTVLLGCVIVLSHIAFVGRSHMEDATALASAQLVCQTRMNEMLAGATPIEAVSDEPIAELPGWGLTVTIDSAEQPGLLAVEVAASALSEEVTGSSTEAAPAGKRFSLVRWIADPEGGSDRTAAGASALVDARPDGGFVPGGMPVPIDVPDESFMPDEFAIPDEPFMPDEFLLPEEPSMLDDTLPEF